MRTLLISAFFCARAAAQIIAPGGMVVELRPVKGVPYTAKVVSSTKRTLVTGSEISASVTAPVARDSEGRIRREQSVIAVGGWVVERSESPTVIVIQDPVKMVNYVLDPKTHVARMNRTRPPLSPEEAKRVEANRRAEINRREPRTEHSESLGTRLMEGLKTEGTRTVTTFPAGSVGNSAPIENVTEAWYSPDLQEVIYKKTTDPRFGETTYRLIEIKRVEPTASLFEVPSEYRIEEGERREPERREPERRKKE
jgi:hypothetical protein